MNKLILAAALSAALVACGDAAEEADDTAAVEAPAPEAAAADAAAAAESSAGTYEYELDGKPTTAVLAADGKYTDTQDGKVVEQGMWADRDGKVCFDPEGDALGTCYTTTERDAEGVFTATGDDGTTLTVKKVG
jgi:hypothetical protein